MKSKLLNARQNRYYYPLPSTDNPKPKEEDTFPRMTRILDMKEAYNLRLWYARKAANQAVVTTKAAMSYVAVAVEGGTTAADAVESAVTSGIAPDVWIEEKHTRLGVPYEKEVGNATWDSIVGAANSSLRKAGNIGSAAHKYPEYVWADGMSRADALEKILAMSPDAEEALADPGQWFDPLDRFFEAEVDEVIYAERALYHPDKKYAGTTDMIVRKKDGSIVILDFKTGSAGNFNKVATQVTGYSLCTEVEPLPTKVDNDGNGELWDNPMLPMPEIAYGDCVHLLGNGRVDIKRVDVKDPLLQGLFLGLVDVYYGDLANSGDNWYTELTSYDKEGATS